MTILQLIEWPFWLIIAATVLPRVNDIGRDKTGIRWQTRRVALVLSGFCAGVMLIAPFAPGPAWLVPLVRMGFVISVAAIWLTTPYLPPWHYWMTGADRAAVRHFTDIRGRLSDELRLLRASYWRKSGWHRCPVCDQPKADP